MAKIPIHPGEILTDELKALNMSATQLARAIRVPANRISQLLAGKRAVTADTAIRLGILLGTGPQFWLNLQSAYELDVAVNNSPQELKEIVPLVSRFESLA
ncbi:MAG: HigA family addiction module antidote protein [Desulfarculales bacterium]|jgi:addiction module HigA family antidote|nr:HigA family addiction module antidote protein [Desulfarculales bacterium]